jgi:S1-C subfamily serine protease
VRRAGSDRDARIVADPGVAKEQRLVAWVRGAREASLRVLRGGSDPSLPDVSGSQATAFAVGSAGHLVTNHHAVDNCRAIDILFPDGKRERAAVVAKDETNDLAVVRVERRMPAAAPLSDNAARPGENVVALGYPLSGLLSADATVTTGTVSALAGLRNDSRYLQFSAPVQPGNSGGPLLDGSGRVVGVVTQKLNALSVASVTGDLPQNVNFALKTSVMGTFLESASVPFGSAPRGRDLNAADVAEKARAFTYALSCAQG